MGVFSAVPRQAAVTASQAGQLGKPEEFQILPP